MCENNFLKVLICLDSVFALCKFLNTTFSPAISTSSLKILPSVSLVFFLTVTLFVPRKVVQISHESKVLCEKKKSSTLNSSLQRTSSSTECVFFARIAHHFVRTF